MDLVELHKWAYIPDLPDDLGPLRDLLRSYSAVPDGDMDSCIRRAREAAWSVARHPFVGRWKFVRLDDGENPCYLQALFRLRVTGSRDVFLDLGCGIGQVLRQLRAAGVGGPQLVGTDVEPRFIDVGYDLFRDRARLGASFVVGDMLDPDDRRLDELRGRVTIIYAGSFFHLFNWTQQLYIGKRLVSFLKPGTRNALIYGRHVGTTRPGESPTNKASAYLHDRGSFQRLWDEVGILTKTRWEVDMEPTGEASSQLQCFEKSWRPMRFTVYQIP